METSMNTIIRLAGIIIIVHNRFIGHGVVDAHKTAMSQMVSTINRPVK